MKHPAGLALLPAEAGARHVALAHLRDATGAYRRLGAQPSRDPAALHDFRVALRRLRVCLEAYQAELSATVSRGSRARMRRLARATRTTRDLEVQLGWLLAQIPALPEGRRAGAAMAADSIAQRMRAAWLAMRKQLDAGYPTAEQRLRSQLGHLVISRRLDASLQGPTMAVVTGRLILDQAAVVAAALERLHCRTDAEAIHTARIAVKRLRYLVEALAADVTDAAVPLAQLVRLQEGLGTLHDMQLLERELGAAMASLPAADPRFAGLVVLRERLDGQSRGALAAVRREWLDRCAERLEAVTDAGHALVGLGSSQWRSSHLRPLSRSV